MEKRSYGKRILEGDERMKTLSKIQTSKLILLVDFIIAITLTGVVVFAAFRQIDMGYVVTVSACWDAQLTAAVAFYYWKAKNENRSKHAMQLVKDIAEQYGIEHAVNLANVVLKD